MPKVRPKDIRKIMGENTDALNEMFEEMLGLRQADPDIIRPKFVLIRNNVRNVYKIFKQLATFQTLKSDFPACNPGLDEINTYAETLKRELYFDESVPDVETKYASLDKEKMNDLYTSLKVNTYIKELITLCSKLKVHHKNFADMDTYKEHFVQNEPGLTFYIFPFSTFDLKYIWSADNVKPVVKKYILTVLHKLYENLFTIYKTVTSPDVDIDRFTKVIMTSINEIKKQPDLHRCKNAFRKIEQSIGLLQRNFDQYYRDGVASGNMGIILENFISDVSNQDGNNPRLIYEFKTIVKYMRKMGARAENQSNPKIKKVFDTLQRHIDTMEKMDKKAPKKSLVTENKEDKIEKNVYDHIQKELDKSTDDTSALNVNNTTASSSTSNDTADETSNATESHDASADDQLATFIYSFDDTDVDEYDDDYGEVNENDSANENDEVQSSSAATTSISSNTGLSSNKIQIELVEDSGVEDSGDEESGVEDKSQKL
jgi:hypothetical protein